MLLLMLDDSTPDECHCMRPGTRLNEEVAQEFQVLHIVHGTHAPPAVPILRVQHYSSETKNMRRRCVSTIRGKAFALPEMQTEELTQC